MYKNKERIFLSILLWSPLFVIGCTGVFIFIGVICDNIGSLNAAQIALFVFMGALCASLAWLYTRKFKELMIMNAISELLAADADGIVPLKELAKQMDKPEMVLLKYIDKGMRKGFLVNMNYNAAEGAVYLSDRARQAEILLKGAPEDKPFVGVHCEGCGASLKIRVKTKGTCPFCGREIIQG